jgi:hypothetical protein
MNLGCLKDKPDARDRKFVKTIHWTELQPIDLREFCPPVRAQGGLGSCTAFGATQLVDFLRRKNKFKNWLPSPLFTYYATRKAENTIEEDSGATIREAIKSTARDGVTMERIWPYDVKKFKQNPPEEVWINAEKHQSLEYLRINDGYKSEFLGCLNDGYPFIFGLNLYTSFHSFQTVLTGIVSTPDIEKEKIIGAHCMMAVGWKKIEQDGKEKEFLIVQNSWGLDWGDYGFCYIPLEYIMTNDSFDFWTIRLTEECAEDTEDLAPEPLKSTPIPEPSKPNPEPIPTPNPEPIPTPNPEPPKPEPPKPEPSVVDEYEKESIWKNPITYFLIGFIGFLLFFFFG